MSSNPANYLHLDGDWRDDVSMGTRFENVTKIQTAIMAAGESSSARAQIAAIAGETEAYNDAHSLAAYMDVCRALATPPAPDQAPPPIAQPTPSRPVFGPELPPEFVRSPAQNIYEPHDVDDNVGRIPAGGGYDALSGVPAQEEKANIHNSAPFPACYRRPHTPGSKIGKFSDCHLIAEGLASKVYRLGKPSALIALKVIEPHPPAPHNPQREWKILDALVRDKSKRHPVIQIISEKFYDQQGNFVLVTPYFPLTLADILEQGMMSKFNILSIFTELFSALAHLHNLGIIHRDIKPSNIVSSSRSGPIQLIDFGTAWDPVISLEGGSDNISEPADRKIIDVGTGPYRAPETLFGNKEYGTSLDMWSGGCVLAECLSWPTHTLFNSPPGWEDGNQLGLIVSIFKTLGTPTPQTWPEALKFPTKPFEWYREFPARPWEGDYGILPARIEGGFEHANGVSWKEYLDLVRGMVVYESKDRLTAIEVFERLDAIAEEERDTVGWEGQDDSD